MSGFAAALLWSSAYASPCRPIDLVFLVDDTSSMAYSLHPAKRQIKGLMTLLGEDCADVRYALALVNDGVSSIRFAQKFTADPEDISLALQTIELYGGGDTPEAFALGFENLNLLSWRDEAFRSVLLVTDAYDDEPARLDRARDPYCVLALAGDQANDDYLPFWREHADWSARLSTDSKLTETLFNLIVYDNPRPCLPIQS
jgi:hypothetical protein